MKNTAKTTSKYKNFADLVFKKHELGNGVIASLNFNNGYGVSVIGGKDFKGDGVNTFEIAILKDGVLDHYKRNECFMTKTKISRRMRYIQTLPPTKVLIKVINTEPTWKSLVPIFVNQIESGKYVQKEYAIRHLNKMAGVCDSIRSKQKEMKDAGLEVVGLTKQEMAFAENGNDMLIALKEAEEHFDNLINKGGYLNEDLFLKSYHKIKVAITQATK